MHFDFFFRSYSPSSWPLPFRVDDIFRKRRVRPGRKGMSLKKQKCLSHTKYCSMLLISSQWAFAHRWPCPTEHQKLMLNLGPFTGFWVGSIFQPPAQTRQVVCPLPGTRILFSTNYTPRFRNHRFYPGLVFPGSIVNCCHWHPSEGRP